MMRPLSARPIIAPWKSRLVLERTVSEYRLHFTLKHDLKIDASPKPQDPLAVDAPIARAPGDLYLRATTLL
jgi:hypothetical protein